MRHQKNRLLELSTGAKERRIFVRQLLTSLIRNGKVVTTPKRAQILKAEADSFFSQLLNIATRYPDEKDGKRECIRYVQSIIYGEEDGKKVISTLLPKYKDLKGKSFVADYKVGFRVGDASPKIMIKLI
jgi:ribosomal protein L17